MDWKGLTLREREREMYLNYLIIFMSVAADLIIVNCKYFPYVAKEEVIFVAQTISPSSLRVNYESINPSFTHISFTWTNWPQYLIKSF